MKQDADHLTRLKHDHRYTLRHLRIIEGNFESADELSQAAHHVPDTLKEMRLDSRPGFGSQAEYEMWAPCEPRRWT